MADQAVRASRDRRAATDRGRGPSDSDPASRWRPVRKAVGGGRFNPVCSPAPGYRGEEPHTVAGPVGHDDAGAAGQEGSFLVVEACATARRPGPGQGDGGGRYPAVLRGQGGHGGAERVTAISGRQGPYQTD